mgnify:FL=1
MKKNVIDFIKEGKRCFDGATGTMLMKMGLEIGGCPEEVDADIIKKVHGVYIDAGAQFLTTNTFGGNKPKLNKYDLGGKVSQINRKNARIAVEAAENKEAYVAGDIGPTGEFIQPYGDFTEEQFDEVFSEQAKALADGGCDLIIVETMASTDEAAAAVRAAKKSTDLPVIGSMTFNKAPDGYRTMMGISPEDAVKILEQAGADIIGSNCSLTPAEIEDLVADLRKLTEKPVLIEPNAGHPVLKDGKTVYEPIPDLETHLKKIVENGADIIGGCCGTDPEYIRRLRKIIDDYNS